MTAVLELRDVHAAYGNIEVLHGIDLVVPEGSIVALLGPNGAGKSTTLRVASGQMKPSSGCVHVAGRHVNGASADMLTRAGVCALPEGRGIFPNLSVRENLWMMTYGDVSRSDVEEYAFRHFPILKERRNQLAGTMSGGEQQMLAMARALVTNPALLLLDEISMGLAPLIVARLYEIVAEIGASGISILLVEQFAQTALGVADYAAIMTGGRIRQVGEPEEIKDELASAYLGGGH
ncbi:MAG: ABC transporter ATP-binding protein [Actinobacteria bacterium]|nr:ABC transporter ATP-binding protein [Actinomycetota bacterium]